MRKWWVLAKQVTYEAEKPPVCLSVCTFWHADNSAVSVQIETGLDRNERCVFEDYKVYFYKSIRAIIHPHECAKGTGVSSVYSRIPLLGGSKQI